MRLVKIRMPECCLLKYHLCPYELLLLMLFFSFLWLCWVLAAVQRLLSCSVWTSLWLRLSQCTGSGVQAQQLQHMDLAAPWHVRF